VSAVEHNLTHALQPTTLIKYLLDELHYYEEGHSDALRPVQREATTSLLGEHRENRLATVGDLETALSSVHQHFGEHMKNHLQEACTTVLGYMQPPAPSPLPLITPHIIRRGEHGATRHWRTYTHAPLTANAPEQRVSECGQMLADSLPLGLCIPSVPAHLPPEEGWKSWVKDWESADANRGLTVPLCDWKAEWYSGKVRTKFGVKYGQRKRVALEFIDV
jgi:hypothetical protein